MKYIKSTYSILALYVLNRDADDSWAIWALDMLGAGFETEHLVILAGAREPYNQFYMRDLTARVFSELSLDFSAFDRVINDYALWLVEETLTGHLHYSIVLAKLKDLYQQFGYPDSLSPFYLLYWADDDLKHGDVQWYWEGATKENMSAITRDYFQEWVKDHAYGAILC